MFFFDWPLYEQMPPAYVILFAFIGAAFGSFFNVLSLRWGNSQINQNDEQSSLWASLRGLKPLEFPPITNIKPLLAGRSACPCCSKSIPLYHNIPIVSWALLRGKAACCKAPISVRYLAFELMGAIVFAGIALALSPSFYGLCLGLLIMVALLAASIDLKDGFIPDGLLLVMGLLAFTLPFSPGHWITLEQSVQAFMLTLLITMGSMGLLSMIAGKGVMGGADQYMIAIVGGVLGHFFIPALLVLVVTLLLTATCIRRGLIKRGLFAEMIDAQKSIPAGPAIAMQLIAGVLLATLGGSFV